MGGEEMSLHKKHLLICFDAFGTLFKPRRPVAQQYAEVATSLGLQNATEDEVEKSFKAAFKKESKANPNFGKKTGMNAEQWWTNIITDTFIPLLQPNEQLPPDLAPKLLHRFWSNEGYELQNGATDLLRYLRDTSRKHFHSIVVGVITNSDPRVPDVLSSLGLRVSPLRYSSLPQSQSVSEQAYDIDFSVMSYDVGFEKPSPKIFHAAEEMLDPALTLRGDDSSPRDPKKWMKLYVGDEYDKDVVGALKANWNAALISEKPLSGEAEEHVKWLEDEPVRPGPSGPAVGFGSLRTIIEWLHL